MRITSTRFGTLDVPDHDVVSFPLGLIGMAEQHAWVLLADAQNAALAWLQSTTDPSLAMALVSPRRYVPDFRLRVSRGELAPLALERIEDAHVLAIVGRHGSSLTLNLRAPLVFNLRLRLGQQVVSHENLPIQLPLNDAGAQRQAA